MALWANLPNHLTPAPCNCGRSTYTLGDGVERSLATTQFEANAARYAFPCFDEPAMKVGNFWLKLRHPER